LGPVKHSLGEFLVEGPLLAVVPTDASVPPLSTHRSRSPPAASGQLCTRTERLWGRRITPVRGYLQILEILAGLGPIKHSVRK
jgi:hypothetical protein